MTKNKITVEHAAELIGMDRRFIISFIRKGILTGHKGKGGSYFIYHHDLMDFNNRRNKATQEVNQALKVLK